MKARDSIALLALVGMVWIILLVLTTGCTSINPAAPTPAPTPIPVQPVDVPKAVDPVDLPPVVVVVPATTPAPTPPHADPVVITCSVLCIPGYKAQPDCSCKKVSK